MEDREPLARGERPVVGLTWRDEHERVGAGAVLQHRVDVTDGRERAVPPEARSRPTPAAMRRDHAVVVGGHRRELAERGGDRARPPTRAGQSFRRLGAVPGAPSVLEPPRRRVAVRIDPPGHAGARGGNGPRSGGGHARRLRLRLRLRLGLLAVGGRPRRTMPCGRGRRGRRARRGRHARRGGRGCGGCGEDQRRDDQREGPCQRLESYALRGRLRLGLGLGGGGGHARRRRRRVAEQLLDAMLDPPAQHVDVPRRCRGRPSRRS